MPHSEKETMDSTTNIESAKSEMWRLVTASMFSYCIAAASELALADAVHAGPLSMEDLARKVDAKPDRLERLVRALAAFGVFRVSRDGNGHFHPPRQKPESGANFR